MKNQPHWKKIYFDGFAGSGTRDVENSKLKQQLSILPEEEALYKGSAERVLAIDGFAFDFYYFIDHDEGALTQLRERLEGLPQSAGKKLIFRPGDCNSHLLDLANALKQNQTYAALVFLDPFGMQVKWESIEALRGTRSDVWILIPSGVIVNRLLDKKGELQNVQKLETFFGLSEQEIRERFYKTEVSPTLFGQEEQISKITRPIERIAEIYVERLKTVWTHVTEKPLCLRNSRGVPIFHFVFASGNPTAKKIAAQILDKT